MSFSCYICSQGVKYSDDIVSTQCGHAFHNKCFEKRDKGNPKCPQCLAEIKTTFKLHLIFEKPPSNQENQLRDLRSDIDLMNVKRTQLQQDYEKTQQDLQKLNTELAHKNEETRNLKEEIKNLRISIQSANIKSVEREKLLKDLNEKNQHLATQINEYTKDKETKIIIIDQLKKRNELLSAELTNEIKSSTQLAVEKVKLKTLLEHYQPKQEKDGDVETASALITTTPNSAQSVIIKYIRVSLSDEQAAKNYICNLSKLMNLDLNENDILQVCISNEHTEHFKYTTLTATFKISAIKDKFLLSKRNLFKHKKTRNVSVDEYSSDATLELLKKCKSLQHFGFEFIYIESDVVFVKRTKTSAPIPIYNENQMDDLKKDFKEPSAKSHQTS